MKLYYLIILLYIYHSYSEYYIISNIKLYKNKYDKCDINYDISILSSQNNTRNNTKNNDTYDIISEISIYNNLYLNIYSDIFKYNYTNLDDNIKNILLYKYLNDNYDCNCYNIIKELKICYYYEDIMDVINNNYNIKIYNNKIIKKYRKRDRNDIIKKIRDIYIKIYNKKYRYLLKKLYNTEMIDMINKTNNYLDNLII